VVIPARVRRTLPGLAGKLTVRDRYLIRVVHALRVLTTHQVAQLAFGARDTAADRLRLLTEMEVVDRFRPLLAPPAGTAPFHYVLGPAGAAVLEAEQAAADPDGRAVGLVYRRDWQARIAHSQKLAHLVGVNGVWAAVAYRARTKPGMTVRWWTEQQVAPSPVYDLFRPDGYLQLDQGGRGVDGFVEYDTGTETLARVAGKLDRYHQHADKVGVATPMLLWAQTAAREYSLRAALRAAGGLDYPVATTHGQVAAGDPTGPVWAPLGTDPWPARVRLLDLADDTAWLAAGAAGWRHTRHPAHVLPAAPADVHPNPATMPT